jgi:hypothetical protein
VATGSNAMEVRPMFPTNRHVAAANLAGRRLARATIAEERSRTRSQYPPRDGAVRAPLAVEA